MSNTEYRNKLICQFYFKTAGAKRHRNSTFDNRHSTFRRSFFTGSRMICN
ncbi:hypothetical protein D1AOALGA4SA_9765 [Olavius algarvensis Delta 1 endosymbiont]|nr:hypothetical protein D1AOALGA4SA_9765 [Olavius algarvensis Delta 1 endosymbiont]